MNPLKLLCDGHRPQPHVQDWKFCIFGQTGCEPKKSLGAKNSGSGENSERKEKGSEKKKRWEEVGKYRRKQKKV